jgi:hypothetical protein
MSSLKHEAKLKRPRHEIFDLGLFLYKSPYTPDTGLLEYGFEFEKIFEFEKAEFVHSGVNDTTVTKIDP